jgi:hypothetical protein
MYVCMYVSVSLRFLLLCIISPSFRVSHILYFLLLYIFLSSSSVELRDGNSSVGLVTRLQAGQPGFHSRQRQRLLLFATASRLAPGPTQPPIQWVPKALSPVVKLPLSEADHSLPSAAAVKNVWSYIYTPPYVLVKHSGNFAFYIYDWVFTCALFVASPATWNIDTGPQSPIPQRSVVATKWHALNLQRNLLYHCLLKCEMLTTHSAGWLSTLNVFWNSRTLKKGPPHPKDTVVGGSVPPHEDVWGNGIVALRILNLGTKWRWVISFTPRPLYPRGTIHRYPLHRRLNVPQCRLDEVAKRKIPVPVGIRTPVAQTVA